MFFFLRVSFISLGFLLFIHCALLLSILFFVLLLLTCFILFLYSFLEFAVSLLFVHDKNKKKTQLIFVEMTYSDWERKSTGMANRWEGKESSLVAMLGLGVDYWVAGRWVVMLALVISYWWDFWGRSTRWCLSEVFSSRSC